MQFTVVVEFDGEPGEPPRRVELLRLPRRRRQSGLHECHADDSELVKAAAAVFDALYAAPVTPHVPAGPP